MGPKSRTYQSVKAVIIFFMYFFSTVPQGQWFFLKQNEDNAD